MSNYYFERIGNLDKDKFVELLLAAKGKRTMRDFAVACGAAPSTFTRIMQKINKGPSSPELITAIAENAETESGVTIDMLADANGYRIIRGVPQVLSDFMKKKDRLVSICKGVLSVSLLDRDVIIRFKNTFSNAESYRFCEHFYACPDIHISTDAFNSNQGDWIIYVPPFSDSVDGILKCEKFVFNKINEAVLLSTTKGHIYPLDTTRYSFIIMEKSIYDSILYCFKDMPVPVDISIILIDPETNSIVDEYMLPHVTYGHRPGYFMTTEPVINHQSSELYEDDFERRCDNEGNP